MQDSQKCRLTRCLNALMAATIFSIVALASAGAASFDCGSASSSAVAVLSPIEKRICSDPAASSLDERIAGAYWLAKQLSGRQALIVADQKRWIARERNVCTTTDCLIAVQKKRYRELIEMITGQLKPVPSALSWNYSTPESPAPNSYCVRYNDRKKTRDVFHLILLHDQKTVCAKGLSVIDCGRRIQEIRPIAGHSEDGISWVEFDGEFSSIEPSLWRALIAYDCRNLYWKVVHKTEVENYIYPEVILSPASKGPSRAEMNELQQDCAKFRR